MSLPDSLVREQGDGKGSPGPSQRDQGPQDADREPTQVPGVGYTLPLFVLPTVREATRMSPSFWRISIPDAYGNSVSHYVDAEESEDSIEAASTTALARAIILEKFRSRLETL